MDLGLVGRTALVTGGSKGIGAAIVSKLAEEGAHVIFCGRTPATGEALAAALGARQLSVQFMAADVESDSGIDALASTLVAQGGVDILVNNVGGSANPEGAGQGFLNIPTDEWMQTYYKCVVGAVRLINQLAPLMRDKGWGRIVNISSAAGLEPGDTVPAEYAAAKAAMNTMTMTLSRSLGGSGVTVNAVTPGPILTEGFQAWLNMVAEEHGWGSDPTEIETQFVKQVMPLTAGRLGRPADIAAAVAFVASAQAEFITGSNLRVDGGLSRAAV